MRNFQPRPILQTTDIWNTQLPIESIWGIYARQSTPAQLIKHTQSTEMQTDDLIAWLIERGAMEKKVFLFDADLGVSGTLRIDQRTGLQELVERILADEIKAVLVYQVSRLFRDETGVQYNVFANICKEHDCILVTSDGMIFNFRNPMHLKMFRYLAEMAAEYIPQQIKMLHDMRLKKARKGLYAGLGPVPSGYIVDYRRESSTYHKFIPYEPHAKVVRYLFERYYALRGNLQLLCRELDTKPVVFPFFGPEVDHRNIGRWYRREVAGGYRMTRGGLIILLTNPAYLGWWIVRGDIVSRTNHQPLFQGVDEELFWYAFDRLSDYTIEGTRNTAREGRKERRCFYQRHTTDQIALLKNRISSPFGTVYVHVEKTRSHYVITPSAKTIYKTGRATIDASEVDAAFLQRFFERLQETHDFDQYRRWIVRETQKQDALIQQIHSQLAEIDKQQEAILDETLAVHTRLKEIENDEERAKAEKEAQPELERLRKRSHRLDALTLDLSGKLPTVENNEALKKAKQFADFQTELAKIIPVWGKLPYDARREFVNLFVQEAVVTPVATHWLQLDVVWSHPKWEKDTIFVYRHRGGQSVWTEEEHNILKTQYSHAAKRDLLALLPQKSWFSIRVAASTLGLKRMVETPFPLPENLSWSDWCFMQQHEIAASELRPKFVGTSSPDFYPSHTLFSGSSNSGFDTQQALPLQLQ